MNRQEQEAINSLLELTILAGRLKGELEATTKERDYLRKVLEERVNAREDKEAPRQLSLV